MNSGVATVAREVVVGTSHEYNWVVVGAGINHPSAGQRLDLSADVNKYNEITDASVIMYPNNGYGDPHLIRRLIKDEKPDALMIFTDPRYFIWLFQIEDEIRKNIPIMYYTIWDDLPYPFYNESYYESCDALFAISKQTENIVKTVLGNKTKDKVIKYLPHGISETLFFPIENKNDNEIFNKFKQHILGDNEYDFIVFWNSRNIHRKHPSDIILAFQHFTSWLPEDKAKKCALIMHTQPIDENGTDLYAVRDTLCNKDHCNVIFSTDRLMPEYMNYLYNMSDVTVLVSSNEGWGLSLTESLMSGTMIIGNVSGGMQDQMRFEDEEGKWIEFSETFPSNHFGRYKNHGSWVKPIFLSNISLAGSVTTPYIFDDKVNPLDLANSFLELYETDKEELNQRGLDGNKWVKSDEAGFTSKNMCKNMIEGINETLETFKPRQKYTLNKIEDIQPKRNKYLVY